MLFPANAGHLDIKDLDLGDGEQAVFGCFGVHNYCLISEGNVTPRIMKLL